MNVVTVRCTMTAATCMHKPASRSALALQLASQPTEATIQAQRTGSQIQESTSPSVPAPTDHTSCLAPVTKCIET